MTKLKKLASVHQQQLQQLQQLQQHQHQQQQQQHLYKLQVAIFASVHLQKYLYRDLQKRFTKITGNRISSIPTNQRSKSKSLSLSQSLNLPDLAKFTRLDKT